MKILIAEDEDTILQTYQLALKSRNHELLTTTDGEECLKIFEEHLVKSAKNSTNSSNAPFDLVILDHRMPKKTGLEIAEQMLSKAPTQRIVIASAYTHELKIPTKCEQALELIQKPFGLDVLFSIVEKIPAVSTTRFGQRPSVSNSNSNPHYGENSNRFDQDTNTIPMGFGLDLVPDSLT
jgi:two-component system cell cycle response regulator CpdR